MTGLDFEVISLVVGFLGLAYMLNRNTLSTLDKVEQLRKDTNQRFDQIQAVTERRFEQLHNEMVQFRTEMNQRFDGSINIINGRFDTMGQDIASLRERTARFEENEKNRRREQNAA